MTIWRKAGFALTLLAGCCWLVGCGPGANLVSEEKEPHFVTGKTRVNAMDYKGAVESFEKSLEVNPRSASAHFELAWLFEKRQTDPAAAVYHFQQYLKMRPKAENAEIVNEHIMACKQELARTVSLGPVTERQQREIEQLAQENKRLRDEVEKWRVYANRLQALTSAEPALAVNRSSSTATIPAGSPRGAAIVSEPVSLNRTNETRSATAPARTHTIRSGETPTTIAHKYGLRVEALMAANPRVNARRLHPGQTLALPAFAQR